MKPQQYLISEFLIKKMQSRALFLLFEEKKISTYTLAVIYFSISNNISPHLYLILAFLKD